MNNASVNVPILPIRSSTGQKSLAGLLNLPKVKPIPSVKLEEAEEQDEKEQEYAPEFCSDEEEFILRTSSNSKKKLEKKGIRVSRISTSIEISTEPSKIGNDVKPFIAKLDYILSNPKTYGDILRWE